MRPAEKNSSFVKARPRLKAFCRPLISGILGLDLVATIILLPSSTLPLTSTSRALFSLPQPSTTSTS